jgi:hypothetical protein
MFFVEEFVNYKNLDKICFIIKLEGKYTEGDFRQIYFISDWSTSWVLTYGNKERNIFWNDFHFSWSFIWNLGSLRNLYYQTTFHLYDLNNYRSIVNEGLNLL